MFVLTSAEDHRPLTSSHIPSSSSLVAPVITYQRLCLVHGVAMSLECGTETESFVLDDPKWTVCEFVLHIRMYLHTRPE